MINFEHVAGCVPEADWSGCLDDGRQYAPCDDENCYGMCEYVGQCSCGCHETDDLGHSAVGGAEGPPRKDLDRD